MGDKRGAYVVWWEYPMERDYLENVGVDGMIIVKRNFKTWNEGA
jgi:hypothetical protein